eukprot:3839902-Lingulodinium_polyedra.AAC.1
MLAMLSMQSVQSLQILESVQSVQPIQLGAISANHAIFGINASNAIYTNSAINVAVPLILFKGFVLLSLFTGSRFPFLAFTGGWMCGRMDVSMD